MTFRLLFLKTLKASDFSNIMIKTVPLDNRQGKKQIFEKVMFCFEKRYIFSISSGVGGIP